MRNLFHFVAVTVNQDGKLTCFCLPGLIFQKIGIDDEPYHLILREFTWSALVWPLVSSSDGRKEIFTLDPDGAAQWFSMWDPDAYEIIPSRVAFADGMVSCERTGVGQPVLYHVIKCHSHELTFSQVCLAAMHVNCVQGKAMSKNRIKLLTDLANHFGFDADELLQSDKTASGGDTSFDATLMKQVLENMEGDEKREFVKMKEKVDENDNITKKKQWKKWFKEKVDEVKAWSSKCPTNRLGKAIHEWFQSFIPSYLNLFESSINQLNSICRICSGEEGKGQSQDDEFESKGKTQSDEETWQKEEEATIA